MLDALLSWDGWTVTQLPAEQAAIFRLEGVPPSEEFLFIQESEALEILFCRKGGLFLEWAGHRRLSLSTDQVLFLPVRTEAYRGRFASEPFYGTLVRMEAKTAWSTLRAMHSDLGESISRAWNDPCMLRAALWSEALFSALDYMQLGHIGDYYVTICRPPNSAGTQIKIHLQRFLTRTDRKTSNSYVIISDRNKVPCLAREGLSNEAPPFLGLGRCYLHGHDFHYRVPAPLNVR